MIKSDLVARLRSLSLFTRFGKNLYAFFANKFFTVVDCLPAVVDAHSLQLGIGNDRLAQGGIEGCRRQSTA